MFDPLATPGPFWTSDPVVREHPLNRGRISWWLAAPPLEGGRQWYDLMGKYHATLNSMGSSASGWRGTTRRGGAAHLLFDGTDDYLDVPANAAFDVATGSAGLWYYSTVGGSTAYVMIHARQTTNSQYGWYIIVDRTTNKIVFDASSTASNLCTLFSTTLVTDVSWHRVDVNWSQASGGACQLYVDGRLEASGTCSAAWTFSGSSVRWSDIGYAFWTKLAGGVDDTSWWNRNRTAAEIREGYDLSRLGYPGVLRR